MSWMKKSRNMKHARRKAMEKFVGHLDKKMHGFHKIPNVIADRILKLCILSFLFLFLGCYMGMQMASPNYVFWSAVISAACIYKACHLLQIAEKKKYEILEGMVFQIKGRYGVGRTYKVGIRLKDGNITQLLMDKGHRFQTGKKYRFYFSAEKEVLSGIKGVDAVLNVDTFYGYEEVD